MAYTDGPGGVGRGAAVGARSLNISEPQIIAHYPDDNDGFRWHHRVLMLRLENASWIVWTPDHDLYADDLSVYQFVSVGRDSPFPADLAPQVYMFQQPTPQQLAMARARAREVGRLLGADVDGKDDYLWVVSEPMHERFGEEVPSHVLMDPAKVVTKRTRGIWDLDDEEIAIEYIQKAELESFKRNRDGGGDLRVLPVSRDREGKRNKEFRDAINGMAQTEFADFPQPGERVAKEYLESIRDGPGNLTSYHAEFVRLSGLAECSAVAHDHRALTQALHYGATYDQINLANSAMAEHIVRRLIQHEMAVERDPRHPDYGGLEMLLSGTTTAVGSAQVQKFKSWLSGKQAGHAQSLKQARLLREERAAEARRRDGKTKDNDKGKDKGKRGEPSPSS